ncbi:translation initiation factor IF-2 [Candidatus Micrarchaeota archaeon]|nr:translation initiation factor IF-2 [Candidatus Micrarchaeota archaeon]
MTTKLRQPILCVLGHVDSGKTATLDAIRNTRVQAREVGGITQHIGASEIPLEAIKDFCKPVLSKLPLTFTIPGLLFIDTPGHDAFTNLRKRGGSVADLAILVVDITRGIEPQTVEAIQILKEYKTPFLVALNKIDALGGWQNKGCVFSESYKQQRPDVQQEMDNRIYTLIGKLYEFGFQAERFDNAADFKKQILIVPVSAKTKEGLSELLLYAAGLAQKFLEKRLTLSETAKGSILEVKEERGLGKTLDVILYDGMLKQGETIVFATKNGPAEGKIKALLKPKPMDEMRDPRQKFDSVNEVAAACGVKVSCENADKALAGSSVLSGNIGEAKKKIEEEVKTVLFESDKEGVVLKADSLGSLEAITKLLRHEKIPVKKASIGKVSKNDITIASAMRTKNKNLGAVFSFHEDTDEDIRKLAEEEEVKLFEEKIIYNLILNYQKWREEEELKTRKHAFATLTLPAKIRVLVGHCFRACKPCIVGVEVLEGRIKKGTGLMNKKGESIGTIKAMQEQKRPVEEAKKGKQVAISIDGAVFGKQVTEEQILYADVPRDDAKTLEDRYLQALQPGEIELLEEIKRIKGTILFK